MGIQLNIKSDEAYRVASELAALTGESLTSAVMQALRSRLDLEIWARDRTVVIAEVLTLGAEVRRLCPDASSDDRDALYSEDGLPQ